MGENSCLQNGRRLKCSGFNKHLSLSNLASSRRQFHTSCYKTHNRKSSNNPFGNSFRNIQYCRASSLVKDTQIHRYSLCARCLFIPVPPRDETSAWPKWKPRIYQLLTEVDSQAHSCPCLISKDEY